MNCITNPIFWKAAGMRALKTFCQTAVALIGTGTFMAEVDWMMVGSASALAAILSVLTSLAGLPEVCEEPVEGKHVKED